MHHLHYESNTFFDIIIKIFKIKNHYHEERVNIPYINQVKPMINGMDKLFAIQNSKNRNYINSIIEKYGLKYVILKTFMKYGLKMPLRLFFSKSPHSFWQKLTFS